MFTQACRRDTDILARPGEIATLKIPAKAIFIVENLQTFLAFEELPSFIVFFGGGYSVSNLKMPCLEQARIFYWGGYRYSWLCYS